MNQIDWGKLVELRDKMKEAENNLMKALLEIHENTELRNQMTTIVFYWNKIRADKGDYPRRDKK